MNAFNRALILMHVLLLFSFDFYNYYNQVWDVFPSQYYVFLNHICSLPPLIGLTIYNSKLIKYKDKVSISRLQQSMLINILALIPVVVIYYYWDLVDYLSSSILLIYISSMGFLFRFSFRDIILMTLYFSILYFGMLWYLDITYVNNPSLYLNGIGIIAMYYLFSMLLYKSEYKSVETKFKIEENNMVLKLLNKDLNKSQKKIEKQNTILKEQNASLNNFVQIVAHDVKAPLKMIQNFSDIIADKYKDKLETEDKPLLDYMSNGSHNLINMVEGLYDFTQIFLNSKLKSENIDFNFTIKRSLVLLSNALSSNKIQVTFNQDFPTVKGDEELLQNVLLNLFGNAIKFKRKDAEAKLKISHKVLKNGFVEICVYDNGIGIPKKLEKKVFQLFKKLHLSTDYEGLGIGLATCKKIIEKHSGDIWIKSAVASGTYVYFTLPLYDNTDKKKTVNQKPLKLSV